MARKYHYIATTAAFMLVAVLIPWMGNAAGEPSLDDEPWEILDNYSATVYLSPGEILSIHFDSDHEVIMTDPVVAPLSLKGIQAIERVPEWTRANLTRTFREIGTVKADAYAQLIIDCSDTRYLDELSFSISHTPPEVLKRSSVYPGVFMYNVELLYQNDLLIDYADIVDYPDHSTVRYWVNESGNRTSFDLPSDVYYWYLAHPKITDEDPTYINPGSGQPSSGGEFWRDYVFNHADTSYPSDTPTSTVLYPKNVTPPLLRSVLSGVDTLWNGESYKAPGGYLNNGTGNRRPFDYRDHAVEKVSNWVEKTLPLNVREESDRIGGNPSRSVQPVRISHNHYGNCGELQDLTIAAARAALIPARGIMNTGEDHVWSEFWERGWHHWDNYWSDGGTGIDVFGNYDADFPGSWGRELSTVFAWRGDDYVESITGSYSDTATLKATVVDSSGRRPVDGARILLATENIYQPEYLSITTWGHTDTNGEVVFEIGDSRNFWGQASCSLGQDPPGSNQVGQLLTNSQQGNLYTHAFNLPNRIDRPEATQSAEVVEDGKYAIKMEFDVATAYLHGTNLYTSNTFSRLLDIGKEVDFYFMDESNHQKCKAKRAFSAYGMNEGAASGVFTSYLTEDDKQYAVLSNMGVLNTEKVVEINVTVYSLPTVLITSPEDGDHVIHTDIVEFFGVAHSNPGLGSVMWSLDEVEWNDAADTSGVGEWTSFSFMLDTTPLSQGEHTVHVKAVTVEQKSVTSWITISVDDGISPEVNITSPVEDEMIVRGDRITVSGSCWDDYRVERLKLSVDGGSSVDITQTIADGNWSRSIDTDGLAIGEHEISVLARDPSDREDGYSVRIYITEVTPPDVSILSPVNNTIFRLGEPIEVIGEASDNVDLHSLGIFVDKEKSGQIIFSSGIPSWNYELETTLLDEGEHLLEVWAMDSEGNVNSARITFIIDGTPPRVSLIYPDRGTTLGPEKTLNVIVEAEDSMGLKEVFIMFERTRRIEASNVNGTTWTAVIDLTGLSSGGYDFYVEAVDVVDLTTQLYGGFTLDLDAPSLYSDIINVGAFFIGDTVYINGSVSDRAEISLLAVSIEGEIWNITGNISDSFWSFMWDTSGVDKGNYSIEITAVDAVGNSVKLTYRIEAVERVIEGPDDNEPVDDVGESTSSGSYVVFVILFMVLILIIVFAAIFILLLKRRRSAARVPPPYWGPQTQPLPLPGGGYQAFPPAGYIVPTLPPPAGSAQSVPPAGYIVPTLPPPAGNAQTVPSAVAYTNPPPGGSLQAVPPAGADIQALPPPAGSPPPISLGEVNAQPVPPPAVPPITDPAQAVPPTEDDVPPSDPTYNTENSAAVPENGSLQGSPQPPAQPPQTQ